MRRGRERSAVRLAGAGVEGNKNGKHGLGQTVRSGRSLGVFAPARPGSTTVHGGAGVCRREAQARDALRPGPFAVAFPARAGTLLVEQKHLSGRLWLRVAALGRHTPTTARGAAVARLAVSSTARACTLGQRALALCTGCERDKTLASVSTTRPAWLRRAVEAVRRSAARAPAVIGRRAHAAALHVHCQ